MQSALGTYVYGKCDAIEAKNVLDSEAVHILWAW